MRYEVTERFGHEGHLPKGSPLEIRIIPEDTNPWDMLIALIQSAYEMDGVHGAWGLAAINGPKIISAKGAGKRIR